MNRTEAIRRVALLREVRVDRGATTNEATIAARKAQQLTDRYGLAAAVAGAAAHASAARGRRAPRQPPPSGQPHTRSHTQPPPSQPFWREPEFAWMFDASTGEHSDNVTVHHYTNRSNWRIEIFPPTTPEKSDNR